MLASKDSLEHCIVGEVRGSNPMASNIFYKKLLSQPVSDMWHPWIGPCVLLLLATQGHMSTPDSPTIDQSASATSPPYGLYGPATSDRTDCTDRYSQHQTFSLFGLTNILRYLLHTDSVWESKYTVRIRKTRQTQWYYFCHIPSTLKIEQNLIPWSYITSNIPHSLSNIIPFWPLPW